MKILAISDEECPALWDYYVPGRLKEYDLIISCGDLKSDYLSFLVTMARCPVLYVHGNHDTHYAERHPQGCDCIDGQVITYNGVRILGLGGCVWYHQGSHQYSEREMRRRARRLRFQIWKAGGVDIIVTHAPPRGVGDANDNAHRGFEVFLEMMDKYKPKYLLHGHVHMNYGDTPIRERQYGETTVINTYERYTVEIPEKEVPLKKWRQVIWMGKEPKLPDEMVGGQHV